MSNAIRINEAIFNGIESLKEEVAQGFGTAAIIAGRNHKTALARGNDRAASYWREVIRACRRLETHPARSVLLTEA